MLALPGELRLAGPVAAQADLNVALAADDAVADEPVHRGPVRDLDAEDLGSGVRVRVEVDEPDGAVSNCDGAHVRLRDRVVAAEDDGNRAGAHDLPDRALDLRMRRLGIGGHDRRVSEVDDPKVLEGVELRLKVWSGWAARGADRPRAEPRSRAVRDEVVGRRADDADVDARELGRIVRVRHSRVREEACVVGLVGEAELAPALERIDHVGTVAAG